MYALNNNGGRWIKVFGLAVCSLFIIYRESVVLFCRRQARLPPRRVLIRPAAQWGGSTSQSQPCALGPNPMDSHFPHSSVAPAQPASGNQAIGVFTTYQNAVPSTSKDVNLLRPHVSIRDAPPQVSDPLPGAQQAGQGTALFTPVNTELLGVKVAVVSPHRTERCARAVVPFPPQERPTDTPQPSHTAQEPEERQQQQIPQLFPARLPVLAENDRPGPSTAAEPPPPDPQTAQQDSLNMLVTRVVSRPVTFPFQMRSCQHADNVISKSSLLHRSVCQ